MVAPSTYPVLPVSHVVRLWLHLQGFGSPRGSVEASRVALTDHLEGTGGLQMDSVNVVERAHYLTLWSRFGTYDRAEMDRWVYEEGLGFEYWAHEASILPASHLPLARRRMRRFPPASWSGKAWWHAYQTSPASKRRVLRRLRDEGPLESLAFESNAGDGNRPNPGGSMPFPGEDKRSLKILWHSGRVAVRDRRHFRLVYDLAERVYPEGPVASVREYEDSWLERGLRANGVVREAHLVNYITGPSPKAAERRALIDRGLRTRRIREVRVEGLTDRWYVLPEHLDLMGSLDDARGTTLICPFDSLLWQRKRAEQLLGFDYRVEIYVPAKKRRFGYYVLPVLHDGALVARVDLKFHRDRSELEARAIHFEEGFRRSSAFDEGLQDAHLDLAGFLGATDMKMPNIGSRER